MSLHIRAAVHPFLKETFTDFTTEVKSYRDIFNDLDTDTDIMNAVVMCGDEIIKPDELDDIPEDDSSVFIRILPEGTGNQMQDTGKGLMWGGGASTVLGAVLMFVPGANAIGMVLLGAGIGALLGGIVLYNTDIPSVKDMEKSVQDPMLRGGRNQQRQYGAIPVLLGKHLVNPDYAAASYTEVDGNGAQWLVQLYSAGYSSMNIDLSTLKVGDTPLVSLSSSKNIDAITNLTDEFVKLEILDGQERSSALYPNIISEKQYFSELKYQSDTGERFYVQYTTPVNTRQIGIDIYFPNGLGEYNDKGDFKKMVMRVVVEYRLHGTEEWANLHTFRVEEKSHRTLRFAYNSNNLTTGQYDLKIYRYYVDSDSSKTIDAVYLGSIRSLRRFSETDADKNRPVPLRRRKKTCLLALKTKASSSAEGFIDTLNFVAQSVIPDWDGEGSGAEHWTNKPTSNPASIVLYLLRGQVNSTPVSDTHIDFPAFEEWHSFCAEHQIEFNACLAETRTISELYNQIATIGRAQILKRDGLFSVTIDRAKNAAVQLFTPRNTTGFSMTMLLPDIPDQVDYTFVNAKADYQNDTLPTFNTPSGNQPEREILSRQEASAWGITSERQLFRYARYQHAVATHRSISYTIECDIEFLMCTKGERIEYAGDVALVGLAYGRIAEVITGKNNSIVGIKSDAELPFERSNENYAIRFRKQNGELLTVNVNPVQGDPYQCSFSSSAQGINEGDLFSFGIRQKTTLDLLVTDIVPKENLSAEITCVDYAPEIFKVDNPNYVIPDIETKLTYGGVLDDGRLSAAPTKPAVSQQDVLEAIFDVTKDQERDTEPPTAPVITAIASDSEGNINLSWSFSTDSGSGVAYYTLYRKSESQDRFEKVSQIENEDEVEVYSFHDRISEKNAVYLYAVTATDKAGNQSGISGNTEVRSVVSVLPSVPENISVKAGKDSVRVKWDFVHSANAVYNAASYEIALSKDNGDTWQIYASEVNSFEYIFDRDTDGYPEQAELAQWKFKARSKSAYGNYSEYSEAQNIDLTGYKTWILPEISFTGTAGKNNIQLRWQFTERNFFGDVLFDVYLGNDKIFENTSGGSYAYFFTDYLEADDIEAMPFRVVAKTEAMEKQKEIDGIDINLYKTWIVSKPAVNAIASEKGLEINFQKTNDFYANTTYYKIYVDDVLVHTTLSENTFFYSFTGYPSAADIEQMQVQVKIETEASSAISDPAVIDISSYKDYAPEIPTVSAASSNRIITLRWDIQDVYGFEGCFIQVAKAYKTVNGNYTPITDEDELEWFAPALGKNPYASVENYKNGDEGGKLEVKGGSVSFSVPLFGQEENSPVSTLYAYRLAAKTVRQSSGWTAPVYAEATATSAQDIVNNAISEAKIADGSVTANKIFVEQLAAISANLGYINDGALQGDQYNYWAVNDTELPDHNILYKGSFRVGGENQYIEVKPRLENGVPSGEYDVKFVVGNFAVDATGSTQIKGGSFAVYDNDDNLIFLTGPDGNQMSVETGTYASTTPVTFYPNIESNENIIILGQYVYAGSVYIALCNINEGIARIYKIEMDNESLIFVAAIDPEGLSLTIYNGISDNISFNSCPRNDEHGTVTFLYENNTSRYIVTYTTASNSFAVTQADENVFLATRLGALSVDSGILSYHGADGHSIDCSIEEISDSVFLHYDADDALYMVVPARFATFIYRIDKSSGQVTFSYILCSGDEVLLNNFEGEPGNIYFLNELNFNLCHDDGCLYFFYSGEFLLSSMSQTDFTSGIMKISLADVVWNEYDTLSGTPVNYIPDFYELDTGGISLRTYNIFLNTGFTKDLIVLPLCSVDSDYDEASLFSIHEYKLSVDYNSDFELQYSRRLHRNAISLKKIADIENYVLLFLENRASQLCASVSGAEKVIYSGCWKGSYTTQTSAYAFHITTFATKEKQNITGANAFRSGVGFSKVLYDSSSRRYRYYLDPDTGVEAKLEFDKNGDLVAVKGDPGIKGDTGEKGEKGDPPKFDTAVGVTTGAPGTNAWAVITGGGTQDNKFRLSLTIPRGETGDLLKAVVSPIKEWVDKTWNYKIRYGAPVWHDNEGNVYFSNESVQKQLVNGEWVDKTWNYSIRYGPFVWRDNGGNIYFSEDTVQKQLVNGEWVDKAWNYQIHNGGFVWHDNEGNVYFSENAVQKQLVNGEWVDKAWNFEIDSAACVWHDNGGNIYYSSGSVQKQLINGEWVGKTWSYRIPQGYYVWHDNNGNIYCSDGETQKRAVFEFTGTKIFIKSTGKELAQKDWVDTQLEAVGTELLETVDTKLAGKLNSSDLQAMTNAEIDALVT